MEITEYLESHQNKEILRFITCGSVDDGKSTLIGRLLHDSKMIFEDQLSAIKKESKSAEKIDLALLVDGLQSEREQGITIDVAYRYFSTDKRKFIIADTPGHEQYTRNMATGASTASLAIILIDARRGVLTQTKRHSFIVNLLGIKKVVVAINKMDLVDYSQEVFERIKKEYTQFATNLHFEQIEFIPLSALEGDNVVNESKAMTWYRGESLMHFLDNTPLTQSRPSDAFRMLVQYVNRPNLDFRGFCGNISSGEICVGDAITVLPSRIETHVKEIIKPSLKEQKLQSAFAPMSITLTTTDEVDISRGNLIVKSDNIPEVSDTLSTHLVWMASEPLHLNQEYIIKRGTTTLIGKVSQIDYKIDVNSLEKINVNELHLNDIALVELSLNQKIALDCYEAIKGTGSFIVIDKFSNQTVGAGMIVGASQTKIKTKSYTEAEVALNTYIRTHYPEWGCIDIKE